MKDKFINRHRKIIIGSLLFLLALIPIMSKVNQNTKPKEAKKKTVKIIGDNKKFKHVSEDINKEEIVEGVKFTNITLATNNGQTTFTADVTNTTNKDIKKENYSIELLDEKERVIITLRANIPDGLKKGETKKITSVARGEFKEIVSKKIKK